ncbi:MAG: LacI family DNA-binding transcriptional regulator [Eubacteriales bacterium]|nr:LacI family DNA-binding transcriptional regulator [Eubacteriales bacterium]
MKRKTIYDVADEAGVSIATVSRVISGKGYVSEKTRQKVEVASENYRPTASAREIQTKKSKTIGIIINHTPEYFFLNATYTNAMVAVCVVAKEKGYRLLLDISDEDKKICDLYYERKVDGFVLMGVKKSSGLIAEMVKNDIPFVLIGNYIGDQMNVSQVDINDNMAIYNATNYLIGLGHKKIGIITGSLEYASCSDRLQGYKRALLDAEIEIKDEYIQICDNLTDLKAEHLAKNLLYISNPVTAIVAFNDMVALAIYKAAKDCGVHIPQQLSVIGFDDTQMASYVTPALTSIWQPSYEKGKQAMRLLLKSLEEGVMPTDSIELNCITMYRDSCAPSVQDL